MFGPVLLVVLGVLSSPAVILMGKRDLVASLFFGVVGWYAVCGCGISWPYSLTFLGAHFKLYYYFEILIAFYFLLDQLLRLMYLMLY